MNEDFKKNKPLNNNIMLGIKRLSTEAKTIFVSIYNLCKAFFKMLLSCCKLTHFCSQPQVAIPGTAGFGSSLPLWCTTRFCPGSCLICCVCASLCSRAFLSIFLSCCILSQKSFNLTLTQDQDFKCLIYIPSLYFHLRDIAELRPVMCQG